MVGGGVGRHDGIRFGMRGSYYRMPSQSILRPLRRRFIRPRGRKTTIALAMNSQDQFNGVVEECAGVDDNNASLLA